MDRGQEKNRQTSQILIQNNIWIDIFSVKQNVFMTTKKFQKVYSLWVQEMVNRRSFHRPHSRGHLQLQLKLKSFQIWCQMADFWLVFLIVFVSLFDVFRLWLPHLHHQNQYLVLCCHLTWICLELKFVLIRYEQCL